MPTTPRSCARHHAVARTDLQPAAVHPLAVAAPRQQRRLGNGAISVRLLHERASSATAAAFAGMAGLFTLALVAGAATFASGYIGLTVVLLLAGVLGWLTTIARCLRFGWRSDLRGVASVHGVFSRFLIGC